MYTKKRFFSLMFTFFFYIAVSANDLSAQNFSAALGPIINMNSVSGFAFGPVINAFYNFNDSMAVGIQTGLTFSEKVDSFDIEAIFRYYLDLPFSLPASFSPFVQAGVGLSMLTLRISETDTTKSGVPLPLIDIAAGGRFYIFGSLFIEPAIKLGYPYLFGFQLMIGTTIPPDFGGGGGGGSEGSSSSGGSETYDTSPFPSSGGSSRGGETYETIN